MRQLPDNQGFQDRALYLVAPLGDASTSRMSGRLQLDHEPTDMHTTDTERSGAATPLSYRWGGGNRAKRRSTRAIRTMPGTRTSTMATRTTTTRTTVPALAPSADEHTHAE